MMATSVKFEGFNSTMHPPRPTIGQEPEAEIYVFRDGQSVFSCWHLTETELREVAATGVVWLAVRGEYAPPVKVSGSALVNVGARASRPAVRPMNGA